MSLVYQLFLEHGVYTVYISGAKPLTSRTQSAHNKLLSSLPYHTDVLLIITHS